MGKPLASGGLELSIFLNFGRAQVGKNLLWTSGRVGIIYLQVPNLGTEPDQAYNFFWISGGLG